MTPNKQPKVAIVCDWLTNMGGAEKVVLSMAKAFPGAPIYTSVFAPEKMPAFKGLDIRTMYLQKLPRFLRNRHQLFPVLRAHAFSHLNLDEYDIVISSSSAEAKAVRVREGATHICYCHTPTRYYWSHYNEYRKEPGMGILNPLIKLIIPPFVWWMRKLDLKAAKGVDYFIANSTTVAARIQKYYGRKSFVLNPPVEMQRFRNLNINGPRKGFLALGRQVPYKRIDLAIQACNDLKLPLTIYGNGSEHERLVQLAGPTVQFVTDGTDQQVAEALTKAEGYFFPQEEDFGIVQIEAMAAGTPVIAYAVGGSQDAVIDGKTGLFFAQQTVESLKDALRRFTSVNFDHKAIQQHAETFSEEHFIETLQKYVADHS
jgi:glycosyltransferase involved in cell wall biosynthesis